MSVSDKSIGRARRLPETSKRRGANLAVRFDEAGLLGELLGNLGEPAAKQEGRCVSTARGAWPPQQGCTRERTDRHESYLACGAYTACE